VGTEAGLFEVGGGRAVSFDVSSGLPGGRIRALQEDRGGVLWVGTVDGLLRFDGQRFDTVPLGPGGTQDSITAIHEDADGTLWMGSATGALYSAPAIVSTWWLNRDVSGRWSAC
jgi:ligand-binding sensor domain-containing protein